MRRAWFSSFLVTSKDVVAQRSVLGPLSCSDRSDAIAVPTRKGNRENAPAADIVIIGGGWTGLLIAKELGQRTSSKIVVLERGAMRKTMTIRLTWTSSTISSACA